jgi:isocitrate dehydrogenase (NAD+)
MATGLMLDHVGLKELGDRLRQAVHDAVVVDGVRTRDLGGTASTSEITAAIIARVR